MARTFENRMYANNREPLMKSQVEYLEANMSENSFYKSLYDQWTKNRGLSKKQIACIVRGMTKAGLVQPVYSLKEGDNITISAKMARLKAEELKLDAFFRNLEVIKVEGETAKAIQVVVKFKSDIATSCHICGRGLDCDVSRATGIGPVCAKKLGFVRPTLKDAPKMLEAIDKYAERVGEIGPIWLPKYSLR